MRGGLAERAELGALLGITVGVVEALRAAAATPLPADSRILLALLGSVLPGAALGAVGLPLVAAILGGRPAGPQRPAPQPMAPRLLRVGSLALAATALAYLLHKLVAVGGSGLAWKVRWGLAVLGTLAALSAARLPLRRPGAPRAALSAALVIGLAAIVIAAGFSRPVAPLLAASIDHGSGIRRAATASPAAPNVLLVVLDTTRLDHLSVYGYPRGTSPFLEELATESLVYDRAVSVAPWTLPAHASLFTGQPPAVHGATKDRYWLAAELPTLAELLGEAGYATAGISCAGLVSSSLNLHQGFEEYYEVFRRVRGELADPLAALAWNRALLPLLGSGRGPDQGAAATVELARRWLDGWERAGRRRPFFLFVNFFEAHLPYDPPEPYRSLFADLPVRPSVRRLAGDRFSNAAIYRAIGGRETLEPQDYAQLAALYDGSLAYQDAHLRELVEGLRARGLLDETVLVVVSDHGENLGEHGGLLGHAFSLHQTLLHVPLIIRYPAAFPAGRRYAGLVSTMSLFPTLLELAGVPPADGWTPAAPPLPRAPEDAPLTAAVSEYGVPAFELSLLVSEAPGVSVERFAVRQRSIQDAAWKLVRPSPGAARLYDLREDPGEERPLSADAAPEGALLAGMLEEFLDGLPEPPPAAPEPLDRATREALRSLGYIQ